MSLVINIYYTGKNGSAKKFAQEMMMTGVVDSIRKEEGNLKYEYYFSMEDEETLLLIDSWKDQNAIDQHHASPMMEQIIKLREKYDLHMRVERYVSDDGGMPESNKAFLRT